MKAPPLVRVSFPEMLSPAANRGGRGYYAY
jgi:hypothetical protein